MRESACVSELWQRSALQLAADIAAREVSSREVVEAHLTRIEQHNGAVNAVVRSLADEALAAADDADVAVAAGAPCGPLHGVPFTVKENIDVAGAPTTQGVPALAGAIAPLDAPSVERMRAAGAIPIARTNLPDFALRVHTDSTLHGLTRNPWNPAVTAGGSSGGEAAAIATGMSPIGLGNDIGGSLRNPAHCCGVASIKPTTGVVPGASSLPPESFGLAIQLMAADGPMARTVADLRALLEVLAGQHWRDPRSVTAELGDDTGGERLRIAVVRSHPDLAIERGISGAVDSAADLLADAGHDVVDARPPEIGRIVEMWLALLLADVRAEMELFREAMGDAGLQVIANLEASVPPSEYPDVVTIHAERNHIGRQWSAFLRDHPIVLAPTWAQPAFANGADADPDTGHDVMLETIWPVLPANVLGLPAAVTPAGVVDGLPVGVQIVADRFADLRCLHVAATIEVQLAPITPIDPVVPPGQRYAP